MFVLLDVSFESPTDNFAFNFGTVELTNRIDPLLTALMLDNLNDESIV